MLKEFMGMIKTDDLVIPEKSQTPLVISDNEYVHAATSDNTRRAYRADIEHFEGEGGSLPSTPEMIALYLIACADHRNSRTPQARCAIPRTYPGLGRSSPFLLMGKKLFFGLFDLQIPQEFYVILVLAGNLYVSL